MSVVSVAQMLRKRISSRHTEISPSTHVAIVQTKSQYRSQEGDYDGSEDIGAHSHIGDIETYTPCFGSGPWPLLRILVACMRRAGVGRILKNSL
jgi:hypothetical protein